MGLAQRAERFRAAVKELGRRGRTTAYPQVLRDEAVAYAQARLGEGGPLGSIAEELKVGQDSLRRWGVVGPAEKSGVFRAVKLVATGTSAESREGRTLAASPSRVKAVATMAPPGRAGLVVHGPGGVWVEGLDVASVAELLRRLS